MNVPSSLRQLGSLRRLHNGAEVRHLTLTKALHLVISQNRALKIARLKVTENEQRKAGQHSTYFPSLTNQSNILRVTELQNIAIPAGALGVAGKSEIAQWVVKLRRESERLAHNQLAEGVLLTSGGCQATAATYKAQENLLQANLGYLLAWAEPQECAGMTPGF